MARKSRQIRWDKLDNTANLFPVIAGESMTNLFSKGTGLISPTVPITKSMLKILLPTILPMAIPALPFLAAETEVTSSGRDVPKATMVRPINRWLMPQASAMVVAPLTTKLLPPTTSTRPIATNARRFHIL